MKELSNFSLEMVLSLLAMAGGIARYLTNYTEGMPFRLTMFLASVFASAFAGIMFGLVGIAMNLPQPIIFMMAGTGGFFAEQTLKLVLEYVTKQVK